MHKIKKSILKINHISKHEEIFRCPICFQKMKVVNLKSIICTNHHCFDVSKKGYVNLFQQSLETKYNKQMFYSRRILFKNGFFEPLTRAISDRIENHLISKSELIKILDAGCGEGSLFTNILDKIEPKTARSPLAVGIDISREGISIASSEYQSAIWCVADITKCPFADKQFNFIINILSPANYSEYQRLLCDDGIIIKVIPESNYLQELRQFFYKQTNKEVYSNDKTLTHFYDNLHLLDTQRIKYCFNLDQTLVEHLVKMTPLSWGTSKEQLEEFQSINLSNITVDLTILVGKKKLN